jgi:hypothetical protein
MYWRYYVIYCTIKYTQTIGMPPIRESGQSDPPAGWRSDAVAGGVDLRVMSPGRKYIVAAAGILGVLAGLQAIVHWNSTSVRPWLILTVILSTVALWCAVGDEVWHLERNSLVHRTGVRRWGFSQRYQNASLDITQRFSTKSGIPYYRLYVVVNGKSSFLVERGEQELQQLAKFISHYTGWQIRAHCTPDAFLTDS